MIRVMIADDDRLTREGFRILLEHTQDIQVLGEARDGQEAVELAERLQPDVVLMDIKMPRLNGLEATGQIHGKMGSPKILCVAMSWDKSVVQQALTKGARGYVAKLDAFEELIPAIRQVWAGKTYFSQQISR